MQISKVLCAATVLLFMLAGTSSADYTVKQARARLSTGAQKKINAQTLNKFLENQEQEMIVIYKEDNVKQALNMRPLSKADRKRIKKSKFAETKSAVNENFTNEDISILTEYDMLPVSHVKVKNREALVRLLNDENIVRINAIKSYKPLMAQSLPLIDPLEFTLDYAGEGTTVVVLDTGLDYTKSPFNCTNAGAPGCPVVFVDDIASDDGAMDAAYPHGTVVATIVHSVATGADLIGLDVATDIEGKMKDPDIIDGVNWAISHQAEYNIVAVNMSLGDDDEHSSPCRSSSYEPLFQNLRDEGIIPVVASGNEGHDDGLGEPACAPSAVSVGAVFDDAFHYDGCDKDVSADEIACFSNTSDYLTLLAPGSKIYTPGWASHGTSMAAPMVAATVAILRSPDVAPNETPEEIITRLKSSRFPIFDDRNDLYFPRLDIPAAILPTGDKGAFFDPIFYYENYEDLRDGFGANYDSLYAHWILFGINEGRRASRYFDPKYYHDTYADIASTYGTNWEAIYEHWTVFGIDEGRRGSQEFSPQYYDDHYSDLGGSDRELYFHWMFRGLDEGRRGSLEFDPVYYLEAYPELAALFGTDYRAALDHWIVTGKHEGRMGSADTDNSKPTPDPSTFSTLPYASGATSISMMATIASDETAVEYYFDETSGYGHDSGWQSSRSYTDTGLTIGRTYRYRVKTRDTSPNHNETTPSSSYSVTLQGADNTPPSPDPATFASQPEAISTSQITMTATQATDASGGVEYYFVETTGEGHDSGWQTSRTYTDSGLHKDTRHIYRVKTRDGNGNETAYSAAFSATTKDSACGAAPMSRNNITAGLTSQASLTKMTLPLTPAFLSFFLWAVVRRRRIG